MNNLVLLSIAQMRRIEPYFPLSHGIPRVDDRRIVSGIIFVIRNGLRWCDVPVGYGPHKTIYNRFIRWSRLGVFNRIFEALAAKGATLSKYVEVETALNQVAEGRTLDDPPKRALIGRSTTAEMLKRLANLDRRLRSDMQAPIGPDGTVEPSALARMAGLPNGWQDIRAVTFVLNQMAAEHTPALPDEISEEEALAALDAYDMRLLIDRGHVPSLFGQPSAALAAPDTGLCARTIKASAVLASRFTEIARRHGLQQQPSMSNRDTLITAAMRMLTDAFDTHALRGTNLPTLQSGMLDHQALFVQLVT